MNRILSLTISAALLFQSVVTAPAVAPFARPPNAIVQNDDFGSVGWGAPAAPYVRPMKGSLETLLRPHKPAIRHQGHNIFKTPTTDAGSVPNIKWPFSLSHNRLHDGGWTRHQNDEVHHLPISSSMAAVNMRLEAGAIRELHWHKTAEWAYVLKGTTQITAVDHLGRNYIANVGPGDIWYFPPGIPHALQATNDLAEGSEFMLVFPDGEFSEDSTFLLSEWLAHTPKEVLAKNFQTDISEFDHIPGKQLYIFPGIPPDGMKIPKSPQGQVPEAYSFAFSRMNATQFSGGTAKVVDSTVFPIATEIAVAEVTVEPGAIRELHWHPTQDEWGFFLEGAARVTVFASGGNAHTFEFEAGDVSFIPQNFGHYVENIGTTPLRFLEVFNSLVFQDVSLTQWLALSPPSLVKAHLGLSDKAISSLRKTKQVVVGSRKP